MRIFVVVHRLLQLQHRGFLTVMHCMWDLNYLTGDQTCIPALEAWILKHWTTKEVSRQFSFKEEVEGLSTSQKRAASP